MTVREATMLRMANCRRINQALVGVLAVALLSTPLTAHADPEPQDPDYTPVTFDLPEPTGRYDLGTTELHLVDNARADSTAPSGKRELMVSVWYPASGIGREAPVAKYMPQKTAEYVGRQWSEAFWLPGTVLDFANTDTHARVGVPVRTGKHPVVVFSPGYPFSRFLNTQQAEDLASRGYIVVSMDHTGETPVQFPDGRFVPGHDPDQAPTAELIHDVVDTRTADTRFVLNQLEQLNAGRNPEAEQRKLPFGLRNGLDLRRTGMFGYSLGGYTAANTMLQDRRVLAGANLDGTLSDSKDDHLVGDVARKGLKRPFLLFGSDTSQRLDPKAPNYDASWAAFWKSQQGWKLNLQLKGSEHFAFCDFRFVFAQLFHHVYGDDELIPIAVGKLVGKGDETQAVTAQRDYLAAFFDQTLRGRPQSLLRKESGKFPAIGFVR
ncbi:lipase [Kribbella endophytica]